jgi:hypothetical protein
MITMTVQPTMSIAFDVSNFIVGLNPTREIYVCPHLICLCVNLRR